MNDNSKKSRNSKNFLVLENKLRKMIREELLNSKSSRKKNRLNENFNLPKPVSLLLSRAGIDISKIPQSDEYMNLGRVEIDPTTLGPFSLVFQSINVVINGMRVDDVIYLELKFFWNHSRGSNKYSVRIKSKDNDITRIDG